MAPLQLLHNPASRCGLVATAVASAKPLPVTVATPAALGPCRRLQPCRSKASLRVRASAASVPAPDSSSSNGASMPSSPPPELNNGAGPVPEAAAEQQAAAAPAGGFFGWLQAQRQKSAELRAKMASLGLAAVLAYGLFDGVTYTILFVISWLGYEARTGLNPTQNMGDIVKICILMWAGNNVTRPFRVAGAAALAPFMDRLMERIQQKLRLPKKAAAFALLVASVASVCFSVVGALFFSRWVRG